MRTQGETLVLTQHPSGAQPFFRNRVRSELHRSGIVRLTGPVPAPESHAQAESLFRNRAYSDTRTMSLFRNRAHLRPTHCSGAACARKSAISESCAFTGQSLLRIRAHSDQVAIPESRAPELYYSGSCALGPSQWSGIVLPNAKQDVATHRERLGA